MPKYEVEIPDGVIPKGYEPQSVVGSASNENDELWVRLILRRVEPVRESRWRPSLVIDAGYSSLEVAKRSCRWTTKFERIDYENGVPVSVTLEPADPVASPAP